MTSEEDQWLHNVGVAALAAVAQYPRAVNEESGSLLVSEVVNAMAGGAPSLHQSDPRPLQAEVDSFQNLAVMHYATHSDADSLPAGPAVLSPRSRTGSEVSDLNLENTVQELIRRTSTWQHVVTIESDSDSQYDNLPREMVVDYEPVFEDHHTSLSTISDDDLEDFIRFYPGEEGYYHQRNEPDSSREAFMHDVDIDEFYYSVNYGVTDTNLPQAPGTPIVGPFPIGDDQPEPVGLHPESIIHTTSGFLLCLFVRRVLTPLSIRTKPHNR